MVKTSLQDLGYTSIGNDKLPVLFPTFKIHKNKFRWISDASNCIFSEITKDITKCLNLILIEFQNICAKQQKTFKNFLGIDINPYWVVKNATEVLINLTRINNKHFYG